MRTSVAILLLFILVSSGSASAEMKTLTDGQLDVITAGAISPDSSGINQTYEGNVSAPVSNENIDAINVISVAEATGNSASMSSGNSASVLEIKDSAMMNTKAMNIVTSIGSKNGVGLNVNAEIGRGAGELLSSGSVAGSSSRPADVMQINNVLQLK